MAPTKPLVAQQISACYDIMGIPYEDQAEITGKFHQQRLCQMFSYVIVRSVLIP